jgi:hypothetical protein
MMKKIICLCVTFSMTLCLVLTPSTARAESVDEKATELAPNSLKGTGEYMHGAGSGKLLMRILMFGSIPMQGVHYMPEGTDLLFSILYAGGINDQTKLEGITIRRRNLKPLMQVNLQSLIDHGREIPKLLDGDIVTVPYNWRRDFATITLVTGFVTAMTGFAISIIALTRNN